MAIPPRLTISSMLSFHEVTSIPSGAAFISARTPFAADGSYVTVNDESGSVGSGSGTVKWMDGLGDVAWTDIWTETSFGSSMPMST